MIYSILTASTDNLAQRHATVSNGRAVLAPPRGATAPVGAIGGFGVAALAGAILFVAQRRR